LLFETNPVWLRYISWLRVALTALVLGLIYLNGPPANSIFPIVVAGFLAYTVVLALRVQGLSGILGLLTIFGDTIFFLVLAGFGAERLLWMAAIFFLYLVVEAILFYTSVELIVIVGVCAAFCALLPYPPIRALLPTVTVAGTLACGFAVSQQRQKQKMLMLMEKTAEAQRAAEKAPELERQRIASDFHDGPLQSFISLQMRLEILRKLLERDFRAGMEDLRDLQTLAHSQIGDLRAFLHSMRPVDVDGANLVATARRNAESFQKESGIPVTFLGTTTPVGLPQETTLEVLQMLRESLHNVQKHAGATRVAVAMEKTDRGLEISVDDNGHGFPFAGTYSLEELELLKIGPASLKRRARSLSADLVLESRPGRGAGLKFRVPLQ
jgi:signal transduction histidine kinase